MSLMTLNDLLKEEIQDLYSAEQQIEKALPAMAAKANLSITPDAKMLEIALA
jgi:ferritin-like metal-binding protein YciE